MINVARGTLSRREKNICAEASWIKWLFSLVYNIKHLKTKVISVTKIKAYCCSVTKSKVVPTDKTNGSF